MIGTAFRNWKYYLYLMLIAICVFVVDFYIINSIDRVIIEKNFFQECSYDYIALSRLPCNNAFVYNAVSAYNKKLDSGNYSGYIKADTLGTIDVNYDKVGFFKPDCQIRELPLNTALVSQNLLEQNVKVGQILFLFDAGKGYPVKVIGSIADTFGLTNIDTNNEKGVIIYCADIKNDNAIHLAFDNYETEMLYNDILMQRSNVLKQINRELALIVATTIALIIISFVLYFLLLGSFLGVDWFLIRNGVNPFKVAVVRMMVIILQDVPLFIPIFIFNIIKGYSWLLVIMELLLFLGLKICLFGANILVRRRYG